MTTQVDPTIALVENQFKILVWNPMIRAGEIWIEGQVPFLALPVIKELDEATINAITDAMFAQFRAFVDITSVKLIDPAHQNAYEKASEALVIIAQEKGVDSSEYLKAQNDALSVLSAFTHINA